MLLLRDKSTSLCPETAGTTVVNTRISDACQFLRHILWWGSGTRLQGKCVINTNKQTPKRFAFPPPPHCVSYWHVPPGQHTELRRTQNLSPTTSQNTTKRIGPGGGRQTWLNCTPVMQVFVSVSFFFFLLCKCAFQLWRHTPECEDTTLL